MNDNPDEIETWPITINGVTTYVAGQHGFYGNADAIVGTGDTEAEAIEDLKAQVIARIDVTMGSA